MEVEVDAQQNWRLLWGSRNQCENRRGLFKQSCSMDHLPTGGICGQSAGTALGEEEPVEWIEQKERSGDVQGEIKRQETRERVSSSGY